MGHPLEQVVEVAVGEDRVARAPEHEGRHRARAEGGGDAVEFGEALVALVDGDVGDEAADAVTAGGTAVGGAIGVLGGAVERRMRERERRLEEGGGLDRGAVEDGAAEGQSEGRRDLLVLVLVDRGVEQHDPGQQLGVADRPPRRDDAAPVVAERDDGTGQCECVGEVAEVGDAACERTVLAGALGEAHLELVDSDDTPRGETGGGRIHCGGDERPPEVGPGGVAVHAEDGADRGDPES